MARQYRTNKRIPQGSTKSVIAALFADVAGSDGMEKVALLLGLGMSRAYDIQDQGTLTLDDAARLTLSTGSPVAAEYLASLARGQFVPVEPINEPLSALVARFAKENGEVMQAAVAMLAKGEAKCGVLASEIDDAIRVLIAARRACTPDHGEQP